MPMGSWYFMDSTLRMIKHMQVLVLAASVTTGRTIAQGGGGRFLLRRDGRRRGCYFQQRGADSGGDGDLLYFSQRGSAGLSGLSSRRNARCAAEKHAYSMPSSTVSATQNCKKRTGQIYSFMVDYKVNGGHRY